MNAFTIVIVLMAALALLALIFSFIAVMLIWMIVNLLLASRAFDAYPFILLNLVLSCIAAIQAPLIMMSQNRQEAKDRERAENDYKVNLKTEIMIEDLYDKVNAILAKQSALEKQLPGITAVQCDVASRASCELAFRTAEQALGHVDVLVSNAGIAQQKLFTDITPEEWQHMLDVNLTGAFHLCQLALPGMIRRKAGRILTVSSMWGQTGGSCEVHYSAAKAGLIGLTKALAKEEGPSGITVNCVAPGVIDTDMMASFTAEDKAALAEETPVGRLGTAEEVAKLLLYLAGEDAGYITGQVFGVNGGLVI